MVKNKQKKELEKKEPFEGSIKACRHQIFEEFYNPAKAHWKYKTLKGDLNHTCLTKQVKKLFNLLHVEYTIDTHSDIALKTSIEGLPTTKIVYDGEHHVRLFFNGLTQSEFDLHRNDIESFLTEHKILFENYCLYICVTGAKQDELTTKYMQDFEKLD